VKTLTQQKTQGETRPEKVDDRRRLTRLHNLKEKKKHETGIKEGGCGVGATKICHKKALNSKKPMRRTKKGEWQKQPGRKIDVYGDYYSSAPLKLGNDRTRRKEWGTTTCWCI